MPSRVSPLLWILSVFACDATSAAGEATEAQQQRFSIGYVGHGLRPAEGVEVTIYGADDLTNSLGAAVTDAAGLAAVVMDVPEGSYVAHARGTDYVDSWYYANEVPGVQMRNVPIYTHDEARRLLEGLGATWPPGTCFVGTRAGDASARASALVAKTDHGGRPYYARDEDDRFDPDAKSSNRGIALVVGVEPGVTTLSLTSGKAKGARTFECPGDAMVFFETGLSEP